MSFQRMPASRSRPVPAPPFRWTSRIAASFVWTQPSTFPVQRMRTLSGEDLGESAHVWIEKQHPEPNRALLSNGGPAAFSRGLSAAEGPPSVSGR
jgi:hypothetical protein